MIIRDTDEFISLIDMHECVRSKGKIIINAPFAFDIETTSFYIDPKGTVYTNEQNRKYRPKNVQKRAIMYVWQFAYKDNVIMGRTWEEYVEFSRKIKERIGNKYIVVYVHNLSYEFQFMRLWFEWNDIFADAERKPMKATNTMNFIYKCSYRLSGYSLAVVARNLTSHSIEKKTGDLNYDMVRNSVTSLDDIEIGYCVNDVLIITAYIAEQIARFGSIARIPLTQTGVVRRYVRSECFKNKSYKNLIRKLTISSHEYEMLRLCFSGGFTHSNAMYNNTVLHDVTSYDFTSSYPTVLISEKYPMSKGKPYKFDSIEQVERVIENGNYSIMLDIKIEGIEPLFIYDNILSFSKCRDVVNPLINNGRIVRADSLYVTVTDVDYLNIRRFYKCRKITVGLAYVYKKDWLPKEIVSVILELYSKKTMLKGVKASEVEYLHSKELLNSIYGMCVTSICHNEVKYESGLWSESAGNSREIEKYNQDSNRFLFYHWGVWCTAYARNNLFTGILEGGSDYVYSDTDSVKILNAEKHSAYFERYNGIVTDKIRQCLEHYGIDFSISAPCTVNGERKPLGVWDFDGKYDSFKTLGAKRYMTQTGKNISITVCGLGKKTGMNYIAERERPFDYFTDCMYIDPEHSGRNVHTYIDNEIEGDITDWQGNTGHYREKSYIHLDKTDYNMSLSSMYVDYCNNFRRLFK